MTASAPWPDTTVAPVQCEAEAFLLTYIAGKPVNYQDIFMVVPRDPAFDSFLALLAEGYTFIPTRCRRLGTDIFSARLMFKDAICISGEEAAKVFYEPDRFTRQGAIPKTALWLLQDEGSVATLDAEDHRHRKQMFMSLMSAESIARMLDLTRLEWDAALAGWQNRSEVALFEGVNDVLCRGVCRWVGAQVTDAEARNLTGQLAATIDGAGALGPRNWRGQILRTKCERWARRLIAKVRSGEHPVQAGSPLQVISEHCERNGSLLKTKVAAVELINLLRPSVAVGRYIVFAALAMHQYPICRAKLQSGDEVYLESFVNEVRRFYPFFPAVGGRVLQPFVWRGHRFEKGAWVLLDLYGTNRDPRVWHNAENFEPERFRDITGNSFSLIPQGGGDFVANHRCAGEWLTLALMKQAVRILVSEVTYQVPAQDLSFSLSRLPTLPKSGFLMRNLQRRAGT